MAQLWTQDDSIQLELAVSQLGRDWTAIAADPTFGLTNYTANALRKRYDFMGEIEEWVDEESSEDEEMVDYYDTAEYINGSTDDDDEMLDDSEWLPEVSEDASTMDWLDAVPDPDYIPVEPEASIVVESNYNLRRRITTDNPNMSKAPAYVCPPNIQELQKPQFPCKWNEDHLKQLAIAVSIHGKSWSKMCRDTSIGLPSDMKPHSLKAKWKSMDTDLLIWTSDSDDDSDFEDLDEDYDGYIEYLLGPNHKLDIDGVVVGKVRPGFHHDTDPNFKYEWGGGNFEVGNCSNPPRKCLSRHHSPPSNLPSLRINEPNPTPKLSSVVNLPPAIIPHPNPPPPAINPHPNPPPIILPHAIIPHPNPPPPAINPHPNPPPPAINPHPNPPPPAINLHPNNPAGPPPNHPLNPFPNVPRGLRTPRIEVPPPEPDEEPEE